MQRVKEFYKEMRATHPNLREPIFNFQFAYLTYNTVKNLKHQGATGVFEKPIALEELKRILKCTENFYQPENSDWLFYTLNLNSGN